MIVGKKDFPAQRSQGADGLAQGRIPNKASVGIPGVGGDRASRRLAFQKETGTAFQFVPYRGNAPALQDLVAGQIDLHDGAGLELLCAGERPEPSSRYAMTSKTRDRRGARHPDRRRGRPARVCQPTLWYGLWVPKGTPKEVVRAGSMCVMMETLGRSGRDMKRFSELGLEAPPRQQQTPDALRAFQKQEADKWWPIIKDANIRPQ